MTGKEIEKQLGLPRETEEALAACTLTDEERRRQLDAFFHDRKAFSAFAAEDAGGIEALSVLLDAAAAAYSEYQRLGIPEKIFWDSMKDYPIWCRDYLAKNGKAGIDRIGWVSHTPRLEIFRLGRLQFAPDTLPRDITLNGRTYPKGTEHLEVHIPAEDPLDYDEVKASFAAAAPFFKKYFGKEYPLFHCHSWLLAPELSELLPEGSRILQFRSLFTVYDSLPDRQAEERVFSFVSDDYASYPEDTSLQRKLKARLLSGKESTAGVGVIAADDYR